MYDYLTLPETKEKCFNFEIEAVVKLKGYVWAETLEEAKELIDAKKWEEIEDETIVSIDSINSIAKDDNY